MDNSDLASGMQEMMAQIAVMQAELDTLKTHTQVLTSFNSNSTQPNQSITSTRRRTLKRLGLALLGGTVAATALGVPATQARVIANPANGVGRIGAIIVPPGTATPGGTPAGGTTVKYGLVATDGSDATFDLTKLSADGTGLSGFGSKYGVYGNGSTYGVRGDGTFGVWGNGTNNNSTGVIGGGSLYGVWGVSANIGM